jgi:hypothetical protein
MMETKAVEAPRRRPISTRLRRAIKLIATGQARQGDAAAKAGLHESYLSRAMKRPDVQALKDEMTREALGRAALRGAHRLEELVDADSEHVSFDASRHALAVAGYKPADQPVVVNNFNVISGYVIDLSPDSPPSGSGPIVDVTPTSEG